MARAKRKKKAKKVATRKGAKAWTAQQVATLRKMYKTSTNREIGRALRRTVGSVAAKARSLKLRKPKVRKKAATAKRKPARRKTTAKRRTTARRRPAARRRKPARKRKAARKRPKARARRRR